MIINDELGKWQNPDGSTGPNKFRIKSATKPKFSTMKQEIFEYHVDIHSIRYSLDKLIAKGYWIDSVCSDCNLNPSRFVVIAHKAAEIKL